MPSLSSKASCHVRTKVFSITFLEIFSSNGMSSRPHVRIGADATLSIIRRHQKKASLGGSDFKI